MDLKQIEKMMAAMNRAGMKRMVIKQEGLEIELEKESYFAAEPPQMALQQPMRSPPTMPVSAPEEKKEATSAAADSKFITSPMVGTFYAAASPDNPAFVKVGDKVEKDTVVCIIEAMKVMNEVKAGTSGTVAEVLLKNGAPVEFGTKLIRVL